MRKFSLILVCLLFLSMASTLALLTANQRGIAPLGDPINNPHPEGDPINNPHPEGDPINNPHPEGDPINNPHPE